ncbi:uncharacterized protein [Cicer arietinum]|uniref:Uncharacterized protein LOC101489186 n=1 Tax=Cicer arietinum TaxID=3827 RepID=A0A1S3E3W3_CICAR|nr:uncharacterized protein LOC101489186 [Cicer arietinum]
MGTEDFSFPRINDTWSYSIDSPPLWNPSSPCSSSNNSNKVLSEGKKKDCFEENLVYKGQRKSFSSIQNGNKTTRVLEDENEDVPMDLLWEVFNEEVVEFTCATTTLTISNTKNALVQTKNKPSMVVILKVLKKFFSINNSQGRNRRRIL